MRSHPSELLGDLAVATAELPAAPERWLRLATAAAAACRETAPPSEALATFTEMLVERELRALVEACDVACERGDVWETACVYRSGLESLRDLVGHREELDLSRSERAMIDRGPAIHRDLDVPDDVPAHHWWWRFPFPPAESALQMNTQMRALLPAPRGGTYPATMVVPPRLRAIVAPGFSTGDGPVVMRSRQVIWMERHEMRSHTELELEFNHVDAYEVFSGEPGPADIAAIMFACARHLAYELARVDEARYRVVAIAPPSYLALLAFHRVRDGEPSLEHPIEAYGHAVLVLDSR